MDLVEEFFRDAKESGRPRQEAIKGLYKKLKGELFKAAEDVAGYVFAMLENLINKELVGLIDWRAEDLCTFTFFTNEATSYVTKVTQAKETWREREGLKEKTVSQESQTTKGKTVHRHVRHDHELIDAKRHALPGPVEVVIPRRISAFIGRIPAWLRPMCHLVDGKQILERRVAVDVGSEDWEVVRKHEPVAEQIVQLDPAITLADVYVLAGWGQTDMEGELARQEREASKRREEEENTRIEAARERDEAEKARKAEIVGGAKRVGLAALSTLVAGGILYWPFYKVMVYVFSRWMT